MGNEWVEHVKETWRQLKKQDPSATYKDAMKEAKKTYSKSTTTRTRTRSETVTEARVFTGAVNDHIESMLKNDPEIGRELQQNYYKNRRRS